MHSLACSSCFWSVYHHVLVRQVACSLREPVCRHMAPSSQLFICVLHTLSKYCLQVIYPHHHDTWSCYTFISQHTACRANTCILYFLAPGLSWCVSRSVKGQVCALHLVFLGHLSYFKALYSAVLLLIQLLLQCFRDFCSPIAIH